MAKKKILDKLVNCGITEIQAVFQCYCLWSWLHLAAEEKI